MKRNYSFEVFIFVIIVTIIVAVIYGFNRNNTDDAFYGENRVTSTYNNYDANMLEPDYITSPPVKGMNSNNLINVDSIDSINKLHLNKANIEVNEDYDIVMKSYNFDELSYMMRKGYTIHQLANTIRTNLSNRSYNNNHNNSSYSSGYDEGYEEGYKAAKRELENN